MELNIVQYCEIVKGLNRTIFFLQATLEEHLVSEITVDPLKRTQRRANRFQSNPQRSFSYNRPVMRDLL